METVTITRRTIVGYGYTASVENGERGNLQVCDTTRPDYTGTVRQVVEQLDADRTLKSFKSGGTYFSEAWFVKVRGKWRKLNPVQYLFPPDLLETVKEQDWYSSRWVMKYVNDEIVVEII